MGITSLSEADTAKRFGVSKQIKNFPSNLTEEEERNVKTVISYMDVCLILLWQNFMAVSLKCIRLHTRQHTAVLLQWSSSARKVALSMLAAPFLLRTHPRNTQIRTVMLCLA